MKGGRIDVDWATMVLGEALRRHISKSYSRGQVSARPLLWHCSPASPSCQRPALQGFEEDRGGRVVIIY